MQESKQEVTKVVSPVKQKFLMGNCSHRKGDEGSGAFDFL